MAGNRARIVLRIALGAGALWLLIYGVVHWRDLRRIEADAAPFLAAFGLHEIEAEGWEESGYLLRAVGTPEDVAVAVLACETEAPVERKEAAFLPRGVSLPPQLRGSNGIFMVTCATGAGETSWGGLILCCEGGRLTTMCFVRLSNTKDPPRGWSELPLPVSAEELARRVRAGELAVPRVITIILDSDGDGSFSIDIGPGGDPGAVVEWLRGMIVGDRIDRFDRTE